MFLTATNRIETIDPAVLRPGRFDEHIYIPIPDERRRLDIIKGISSRMPISLSEIELKDLVEKTSNWSGM